MKTTEPPSPKFLRKCEAVSEKTHIDLSFSTNAGSRKIEVIEDDGALIICKNGIRAVFSIGQDYSAKIQNERIRLVLTALKLDKFIDQCLHEETEDDEDEECPHCEHGR